MRELRESFIKLRTGLGINQSGFGKIMSRHTVRRYEAGSDITLSKLVEAVNMMGYSVTIQGSKRPPIGIIPSKIYHEDRIRDIERAVKDYMDEGLTIPAVWLIERNILLTINSKSQTT